MHDNDKPSLLSLIESWFIQEVPEEIYACEFCRKLYCSESEFQTCKVRLEYLETRKLHLV